MKIRRSNLMLILIFTLAALLIFAAAGLTYRQLQKLSDNTGWVYHSQKVSLDLEKLYANLKDIETERRNLILNYQEEEGKKIITDRMAQNEILLARLKHDISDNPSQLRRLQKLHNLIDDKYKVVQQAFYDRIDYRSSQRDIRESLLSGKAIMYNIKKSVDEMMAEEDYLLKKRRSDFLFSEKSTPVYLFMISIFSLAVLFAAFLQIYRDLGTVQIANAKLRIALATSKLAENVGNFGIWTYNAVKDSFDMSDNQVHLLQFEKGSGKTYSELATRFHKEDLKIFNENIQAALAGKFIEPFITRYRYRDGSERYFMNNIETIHSPGTQNLLLGIARDVTEDVQNKAKLTKAHDDLQFYFSSSRAAERIGNYGFWRWTADTNRFWFSDNLYRIFGIRSRSAENFDEMMAQVHPKDQDLVKEKLRQIYAGESVKDFTHRIYRKIDGQMRYLNIIAKKMDWNKGLSYLVITSDVTDQMRSNQNLEEQNRVLDTNNRELQAFNYVASHDLQEPLRKIETFISRLKDKDYDQLSEVGKQYLDKTKSSAARMRKLIDDLLQFSRSTRGDAGFETTDLNIILEEAKENLLTMLEQKNAKIFADHLPEVAAIPFQMKQLFTNLISNSLKYSKTDVPPVIHINCERVQLSKNESACGCGSGEFHKISFRDNGIGFNNDYAEKIFQLFHRLHGKSEYEGTGIGLAICKKIVENHQGCISADGYEGTGAEFIILLPSKNS